MGLMGCYGKSLNDYGRPRLRPCVSLSVTRACEVTEFFVWFQLIMCHVTSMSQEITKSVLEVSANEPIADALLNDTVRTIRTQKTEHMPGAPPSLYSNTAANV